MKATTLLLANLAPFLVLAVPYPRHNSKNTQLDSFVGVQALANGIQTNINAQVVELAQVKALQKLMAASPVDAAAAAEGKAGLVADIQTGIAIRALNQAIAPAGNAAIAGLAKVQDAQATELSQAQGLTGDPTTDNPVLAMLNDEIVAGTAQNEANKAAALSGPASPQAT